MAPRFRLVPVPNSGTLRVLDGPGERRAVALICAEPDGTVCLVPVQYDHPPAPLTGRSMPFPDVDAVADFLGIPAEARAA